MEHSAIQRVHSQLSDIAQPSDQLATWISDDLELLEVYEGLQIRTVQWEKKQDYCEYNSKYFKFPLNSNKIRKQQT